jgi:hypothetical protein
MTFAATVERANLTFSTRESAGELADSHIEQLNQSDSFLGVAQSVLRLAEGSEELAYIEQFGEPALEGVRAAMVKALGSNLRVQFQFSSAYDFAVTLSRYDDALVVHFSGPTSTDAAARRDASGA